MSLPIHRVVLFKHGVGYFERQGSIEGDTSLSLTVKQAEVSDVLKSLTVLDLDGGHVTSVSYDSTRPLEQLLQDVALSIPDQDSLVGLLPQIKGARLAVLSGSKRSEGVLLGIDSTQKRFAEGIVSVMLLSLLTDQGCVEQFDLHELTNLELLDTSLRRDLDYYLRTQLLAKKKDARTFTFFARGQGKRTVRISYLLEAPVWKATYRILLGDQTTPSLLQGWAVVDNTQDEDWQDVQLSLVAGLPVSFIHDLYTPRYIRRPVVAVRETTGVLPPVVEEGLALVSQESALDEVHRVDSASTDFATMAAAPAAPMLKRRAREVAQANAPSSMPTQVRERKLGDLFEYQIEHPVTIRRNQSALVPIVLRPFQGRPVLLHNRDTRPQNPMRCVEFTNSTGLTLEGGPVTVLEAGSYVGEAMLETMKPDELRLIPYAVELAVFVLDNVDSHEQAVHQVIIRDGQLILHARRVQKTTYTFDHKGEHSLPLYLDHPRGDSRCTLLDTPSPVQTTDHYWRFLLELPARKQTRFVVQQQLTVQSIQLISNMEPSHLSAWLDQQHVDPPTEKKLRQVLQAQQQLVQLQTRLSTLENERTRIHQEQQRIRDNLSSLSDRSSEKELRERFVRTLHTQEDRLEQIDTEVGTCITERDRLRAQINSLLATLQYQGNTPG